MSSRVIIRGPATTASPIRSSARLLRNGCTPSVVRGAPVTQVPVTAETARGEPWIAVRCM